MKMSQIAGIALCALVLFEAPLAGAATSIVRPVMQVDSHAHYKVVYDIRLGETAAGVSKGLYYARGLIEAFGKQGVKPSQLRINLVLHGDAAQFLLIDSTYQQMTGDPFAVNLNAKITQNLLDLGVHVEICRSVMKSKGWTSDDILPGVTIVHDGFTRMVKLQNDGYAYIGGF